MVSMTIDTLLAVPESYRHRGASGATRRADDLPDHLQRDRERRR
ncbi:hypothetical protein [Limosilactobacillus fermentum]